MSATTRDPDGETAQIIMIADQMRPLMSQLPSNIQGGVLASLLASWLAGHELVGDRKGTLAVQKTLMNQHFQLIRDLLLAQQAGQEREA